MSDKIKNPQEAFPELLLEAIHDAALEGELTQLQTQFIPEGKKEYAVVRVIVVPEKLANKWPTFAPAGTPTQGN